MFFYLVDGLHLFFPSQISKELKKKVLFVRLDAIGDFVLWLDAAGRLRDLFSQDKYEITLLGNQAWTSIAEKLPYFDEVWSLERNRFLKNLVYRFKILKKIRKAGFDVAIQPTFSREFLFGDAIVRASGAKERIGSQGDYSNIKLWQKRMSDRWYTRLIQTTEGPLMELKRNAEFMRGLGLTDFKSSVPEILSLYTIHANISIKDYYLLFPGAGMKIKQWPLFYFRELATRIYRTTGWVGLICGKYEERSLGNVLTQGVNVPLYNWIGLTSLPELIAIIQNAHIVVGNDTSSIHIAAAVSTPAVCILGGGHYGRFLPYQLEVDSEKLLPIAVFNKMNCFGCGWECIYDIQTESAAPCVEKVSVDDVWNAVLKVSKQ